jgi:hypothetical protein
MECHVLGARRGGVGTHPGAHPIAGWAGLTMLELGNQEFCNGAEKLVATGRVAKDYFERLGVLHTSIDITGRDGALALDLSKPIDDVSLRARFDVVTNFGTSEHVEPQYECWRNVHLMTKVGGVMVHEVPEVGHWPGHCRVYYSERFFRELALVNGYEVLELFANSYVPDPRNGNLLFCVLRKADDRAFMPEESLEALVDSVDAPVTVDEYWKVYTS